MDCSIRSVNWLCSEYCFILIIFMNLLFVILIVYTSRHPCIISCHFNYTNPKYVLFPVKRLLQYSIPENIMTLASSLTGQPARAEQLAGFNQVYARLQAAVSRKAHYIESDPQWFEHTHHRVDDQVPVEEEDPVDLIPLPPSLRVRVENEEVFERLDTMPMDELEQKLKKLMAPFLSTGCIFFFFVVMAFLSESIVCFYKYTFILYFLLTF